MRFREATYADVPAIAATFEGRNALPLEPRVRQSLRALLTQLICSPACTLTVFEEVNLSGMHVVSFAGGIFLRDGFIDEYLAAPYPGLLSAVLVALLDGRPALATEDEIRRLNSADGLIIAVFPIPYGRREWDDQQVQELRNLAPQALMRDIGGYRLRAIYYEVFTDEAARYVHAGGYKLLNDFSGRAGTGSLDNDCRPRMLRLTRADIPPGAMSMATQMFDPPQVRLGLTPAEQRVALGGLRGASDRSIAATLGLSTETVRSNWRSIYQRLTHVLAEVETSAHEPGDASRGLEKRRVAIEYLRQNMHELRPVLRLHRHDRPRVT
jgi:DNA-binding CsgD family transcriptional regulator